MTKHEVLKFISRQGRVFPIDLAVEADWTLGCSYSYLRSLHNQGLLIKGKEDGRLCYYLSAKGAKKLQHFDEMEMLEM